MPNLSADRALFLSGLEVSVDVRRLMYQTLICRILGRDGVGHQACGLSAAVYSKFFQSPANALIDGVRADAEANRDFLAAVVPVDQKQAFDLSLGEASNGRGWVLLPAALFNAI